MVHLSAGLSPSVLEAIAGLERRVVAADVPGDFVVCRQVLTGSAHHTLAAVALDDLRPSPRPEPPIDAGVTRMRRHGRPPALPHQER